MRITYTYDQVIACRSRRGKCVVCGRVMARQRTFSHTINPWNVNAEGRMKSHAEVRADVDREADAWVPEFIHERCRA